ncbi:MULTISPECIES: Rpn family recombination-promoting nuclease/putative transposase [unclassified Thiocapsa]|uniref:Rpn family recombination-promoting nuclease/putative transposase n=1 Tax=unclassified Thiocapsa TaxID=2641286 RepID=UPI0035AF37B5
MYRPIDPKVDCVFKTLFGSDDHRDLLIHFLNALLADDLAAPITAVDILNPYNERETLDDKLTVVDVKARDAARRIFQIEIQLVVFANLAPRILDTWADLFSQQLQSGGDYRELQPVYAIWILDATLFRDRPEYAHRYRLRDDRGRPLVDHGTVRVFELSKFDVEPVQNDAERWLKFLKDGARLDPTRLPVWMQPPIMRSAMSTLNAFSEKERDYHRYQSRQEALRVQRAVAQELEERRAAEQAALQAAEAALQAKEAALQDRESERQAKEAALAEIARLRALLERQTKG